MTEHFKKYKEIISELESSPHYQNASRKNQKIMESKAMQHLANHRREVDGKPILPVK